MTDQAPSAFQNALAMAKSIQEQQASSPQAQTQALAPIAEAQTATPVRYEAQPTYSVASIDAFLSGPVRPDAYLKVNGGLMIGSNPTPLQEITVALEVSNNGLTPSKVLRFGDGPSSVYKKTYDGKHEVESGEDFATLVTGAKRTWGDKAVVYDSADLLFTVVNDIKGPKGDVILEAGKRLGYSTPKTGADYTRRLAQDVLKQLGYPITTPGLIIGVKLTPIFNQRGTMKWWNVGMELVGSYDENAVFAPLPGAAHAA